MIPIGERAIGWTARDVEDARPGLVAPHDDGTLFLTPLGEAFTPNRLTQMVRGRVNRADLGKTGSCHLFRHAMATLAAMAEPIDPSRSFNSVEELFAELDKEC